MNSYLKKEDIDIRTLELDIDNPFLEFPVESVDQKTLQYATVTAKVRNVSGKPLPDLKVHISDDSIDNLQKIKIYDAEQKEIIVEKGNNGFDVTTDQYGNIKFYIYPVISKSLIINLTAQVIGSTGTISAKYTIYSINHALESVPKNLIEPEIFNFHGEDLKSNGKSKFTIGIVKYADFKPGDHILFFVNDIYTKISIQVENEDDLNAIDLPYCIFNKNELSRFSYLRISSEYMAASQVMDLIYHGNPYNKPWTDVNRTYDTCIVYNSVGVSDENIVEQWSYVNSTEISNYRNNPPDNAGLFVQITGEKDAEDNGKVPLGSTIYLNLYINSSSRTVTHTFENTMPFIPDSSDNTAKVIFNIPHHFLTNCLSYPNRGGDIYFDYQIGKDSDKNVTYGNIWEGYIATPDIE
ncbi:hypothetical protein ID858_06830 [Xenorhabdus sp. DI]|uniref:hypothetical protein n=1 Tax=Xenorhabdus doucetiae TaxID=351671 RepID=UPI0019ACB046|nr:MULTISPECIES: hypothetical protein [unclassified Xenorhabdus]MBD2786277.1 hypothetical protein [Xenorhabdus sp. 3]MBD2788218.1 hypothetical protein [Xenorhabdus sp. DI]